MVDRSVGSAGTLRITDDGTTVRFYVLCSDPATNVGEYRFAINGQWATISLGAGFGSRLLGTRTYSKTTSVSLQQAATGTQGLGGAATLSTTITRALPGAPSGLTVVRESDSRQKLNWSRNDTYTSVVVQRTTFDGATWSGWQQVGIASGNAYTFTDTTTVSNRRYVYRVAGRTASGQSGWSGQTAVHTTPAAPTGVKAVRSGDDIVVSATSVPLLATSFDVEDGGEVIASSVSLPYTHVSPDSATPHQYRVRGKVGALNGVWSALSNAVQLISPPNAPAGLSPNGTERAADQDVLFTWVHNPVDSSAQTAYELRHRVEGGAWTTLTGTTASQRAVSLEVGTVQWQVRTKGTHPDWSPWASTAVVVVIDRPGVAITQPETDWDAAILRAEWSWFQAQSRPQSAWQAELLDDTLTVVETRSGNGSGRAVTMNHRLVEGAWTVRVRARTGDVWSEWSDVVFDVLFDPPAPGVLDAAWDESQGGVTLTVEPGLPGGAVLAGTAWVVDFGG